MISPISLEAVSYTHLVSEDFSNLLDGQGAQGAEGEYFFIRICRAVEGVIDRKAFVPADADGRGTFLGRRVSARFRDCLGVGKVLLLFQMRQVGILADLVQPSLDRAVAFEFIDVLQILEESLLGNLLCDIRILAECQDEEIDIIKI